LLAARILATSDAPLAAQLEQFAVGLEALVVEKNAKLQRGL